MTARLLDGLAAVAERYDAYLLDQFGVLHDGTTVYPGVIDCLEALKGTGKRVVILSNSGTRHEANRARLARLGIPEDLYEDFVTSGEVTRTYLGSGAPELRRTTAAGAPLRCLPLGALTGGTSERAILTGLDVAEAGRVEEADFVMVASFGQEPPPRDAFDAVLAAARRRGLTLVCANPDVKGVSPDGLIHAPGALAADYEAAGGTSERAILTGLDVAEAGRVEEADFVMVASFGQEPPPRDAFDAVLAAARRRGLTLVCANPDVKGVSPDGLTHAPGAVAADYEAAGGTVVYIGKPHPLIYRHVLDNLAPLPAGRVLAVGDSLSHDVAGAHGVGVAAALVIEGIHHEELGDPAESETFESRLAALERRYHAQADYLLRRLAW